jgi:KDO2-lipid IV(A) lauroyltransferase
MNRDTSWKIAEGLQKVFRALPYSWSASLGAGLGALLWAASKKKVDQAETRCVRALQVGVTEARRIVRGSYMNLGRMAAEFLSMDKIQDDLRDLVEFHGEEHLREALARGKGVLFLSGHVGNWEIGAAAVAERGYPMNAIGTEQRDERITDLIIQKRAQCGVTSVGKGFDLKAAIRCLQRGEALAILIDQDVREKGVVVPFLGLPASTPYGPAKIARKLGSTILPSFMVRRGTSLVHDFYILPSPWEKGYPDDDEDMVTAMTLCNDAISRFIREYPEQWMWLYPRWASTEGQIR